MIRMEGLDRFTREIAAITHRADAAAAAAVKAAALLVERETKLNLGQTSHTKGTPTPSAPGQPPALVSGALRRSITSTGPEAVGFGRYRATVGPTVLPYAAIQERGGQAGRNHSVSLPARPYLAPALARAVESGAIRDLYEHAFNTAIH